MGGPFWLWTPGSAPEALPYSRAAGGFAISPRLVAFGADCANPPRAQRLSYGQFRLLRLPHSASAQRRHRQAEVLRGAAGHDRMSTGPRR